MNAYELADIVDRWAYKESAEYLTDAANMLRQQADRIVELEEQNHWLTNNPLKELSDEEIVRISETCDLNHVLGLIDFARAILKKASEK